MRHQSQFQIVNLIQISACVCVEREWVLTSYCAALFQILIYFFLKNMSSFSHTQRALNEAKWEAEM